MDLTEYRRIHGIKAADLAKRLGVAPSSVSRLEHQEGSPSRDLIMAIRRETANLVQPNDLFPPEPESPTDGRKTEESRHDRNA